MCHLLCHCAILGRVSHFTAVSSWEHAPWRPLPISEIKATVHTYVIKVPAHMQLKDHHTQVQSRPLHVVACWTSPSGTARHQQTLRHYSNARSHTLELMSRMFTHILFPKPWQKQWGSLGVYLHLANRRSLCACMQ